MILHKSCVGYHVVFMPAALKDLAKIDQSHVSVILDKIKSLIVGQLNLDIKKLKSQHELYRLRAGEYRIVYSINNKQIAVYVVAVGHRKEVYKKAFKRI